MKKGVFSEVHALVRKIPRGRVATYGQLSQLIRRRLTPVGIGWAMGAAPDDVPWHRVVNSRGTLSTKGGRQRALLEAEGVVLDRLGAIDLARHLWKPRRPKTPRR
jgi:methylated-DNA-protein-cysteine methyltransferase-like protein